MPAEPSLLEKVARTWLCMAAAYYVYDLFELTRDGLTGGPAIGDKYGGRAFGEDFINSWSGAWLAWHGRLADIYHMPAYHLFQESVVGPAVGFYNYSYPPVLLVLTAPLALVPYVPGLFLWLVSSWYAFYRALRLAMPGRKVLLLTLATPAMFLNVRGGQNGAWTAALIGGGLALLGRRPIVAGVLFGLQIYKPHLGLLIPVALIAGRHWRTLAAASVTAAALIGLSIAVFGTAIWADYAHVVPILRQIVLEEAVSNWHRMVSVFIFARRLGADVATAYGVQVVAGSLAAVVVAMAWYRDAPAPIKNTALVLGSFLAVPYLQDYDLVLGAFAAAWLTDRSAIPQRLERPTLVAAALTLLAPGGVAFFAQLTGLELGPLFFIPGLALAGWLAAARMPALPVAAVAQDT